MQIKAISPQQPASRLSPKTKQILENAKKRQASKAKVKTVGILLKGGG